MCPPRVKHLVIGLITISVTALITYYNVDLMTWIFKLTFDAEFRPCEIRRRVMQAAQSKELTYVTLPRRGRLGNWMFTYASLLGIAKRHGKVPYLVSHHPLSATFDLTNLRHDDVSCLLTVREKLPAAYDGHLEKLPYGNISVDGYLQSWRYFEHIEADIRKAFRFRSVITDQARRAFASYTKDHPGKAIISIHVRRTDMLIPTSIKFGFKGAPLSYLQNAMGYMRRKFPGAIFLVLSDDMRWCQDNLKASDVVFTEDHVADVHMAMLTMCEHSIVTTGTFGWWGAWLAGGHTVYYANYPEPGSVLDRQTRKEDFYPPHWVALSRAASDDRRHPCLAILLAVCAVLVLSVGPVLS